MRRRVGRRRGDCWKSGSTARNCGGILPARGVPTEEDTALLAAAGALLDLVRTNVDRLRGSIDVESKPGEGCTLRVQLGTTLATAHILLVAAGGQTFALPAEFVETACLVQTSEIFTLEGHSAIRARLMP